ncbi:unnamed protein product (macronuclear) [Paramecium tetraurelia]|uniref:TPX2 central domain-containing protein n=1 Tax=Paramecium tetraurelia TaxID=5888 RepID=A0CDR8_PARTE|nr:uncharacterized protein GSPATT00007147001 [Paramecium tetraurelia]CAK68935.1 unnamed protein product [Paramecium tetraurelia]|eukprot:XP_001436332.1 hypothetical protein (macronuclear) [Paramecium tetraurelia strain d4-2]
MNSTSVGTRMWSNRKSMSNLTINKLLLPTNQKSREKNCNSNNQQISDQLIEENMFFLPKRTLRRVKHSDQNILTTSVTSKSLQSQMINKYFQESLQFRQQQSRKEIVIKELVSPSKPFIFKRKETALNTEPCSEIQQQKLMPLLKSSINYDDQYKFTFYSPKTQDHKLRLPKEFQILPCSKKRYFI